MATVEAPPEVVTKEEVYEVHPRGFARWLFTIHHTDIGLLYFVASFGFFLLGGLLAVFMRWELFTPEGDVVGPNTYNSLFTIHGTTMVFLFIIPLMSGFGNYFVPLMVKAHDMAFPRLNNIGFWMVPPGGALIWTGAAAIGWTGYPPNSLHTFSPGTGVDLWIVGLLILGTSSLIGSINFIVTIFRLRSPGVTFRNLNLFVWAMLVQSMMLLLALPVITAALVMLFLDRNLGTCFFNPGAGCVATPGDPILWQHLFWFFAHPEVYIMILPVMGVVSAILPGLVRKPIFGYRAIAYSSVAIGAMGFLVWVHHMFTTGIDLRVRIPFMLVTMAIAVPSGVKIFNWLATIWGGDVSLKTPMLFVAGFLTMFTIGGISGVFLGSIAIDYQLQDTYWVVAHLHYVLFGGSVLGAFAGLYYWFPTFTGRMYNEALGVVHWLFTLVGFNLTFFPQHFLGLSGMPRRVWEYDPQYALLNQLSTLGATMLGLAQIVFFYNVIKSIWKGPVAPADPWG